MPSKARAKVGRPGCDRASRRCNLAGGGFWEWFEKLQGLARRLAHALQLEGEECPNMRDATQHRDPNQPRQPEVPVIDDPPPVEPKVPEMPPPVPDPPDVVGRRSR
jgi:hypothetical protein